MRLLPLAALRRDQEQGGIKLLVTYSHYDQYLNKNKIHLSVRPLKKFKKYA